MAISKETRLKIEHELRVGKSIRELSKKYNVSYATINSWKNKLTAETTQEEPLQELVQTDEATLLTVAEKVKETAPEEVKRKVDKLVDGVVGLQKIDEKFRTVVYELLEWAEERTKGEMSIKDWATISNTIGSLYSAIFSKNVTNVNVMNNTNISGEKREIFKASKGI